MTDCAFALLAADLDDVVGWVTHHRSGWPLYGRLWAWTEAAGYRLDPEDAGDRHVFRVLREMVAARIIDCALDRSGWTFEQLELDGMGKVSA